ncbi:MAG: SGNH hydrolase domain-containing protein [Tepidamorphaceae bacterium]
MSYVTRVNKPIELTEGFGNTIEFLQYLGHKVILVGDIPRYNISPEDCKYGDSIEKITAYCSMPYAQFQIQRDIYEPVLEELADVYDIPFIRIHEPLCDKSQCNMLRNGIILYRDYNHLNIPGSILIGNYLSKK